MRSALMDVYFSIWLTDEMYVVRILLEERRTCLIQITLFCITNRYCGLKKGESELLGVWPVSIIRNSKYQKTQSFGNWVCFRSKVKMGWGGETSVLLSLLERANLNHWTTRGI
jgi:hypothetical protein